MTSDQFAVLRDYMLRYRHLSTDAASHLAQELAEALQRSGATPRPAQMSYEHYLMAAVFAYQRVSHSPTVRRKPRCCRCSRPTTAPGHHGRTAASRICRRPMGHRTSEPAGAHLEPTLPPAAWSTLHADLLSWS